MKRFLVTCTLICAIMIAAVSFANTDTMSCATKSKSCGFYGVGSVTATIDKPERDFSADLSYLAIGNTSDRFEFYSKYDLETDELDIQEAFANFKFSGLDFRIGRMVVPFGINYLDRPYTSVFITVPNADEYKNGVGMWLEDNKARIDGFYGGEGSYTMRGKVYLFDKGLIPSVSWDNQNRFNVAMEAYGESLFLNASLLSEWHSWNGDFWARSVLTPGFYDKVGLLLSYYNTGANLGIADLDFTPDAWTYGLYCELEPGINVTAEWKSGEDLTPVTIRFATIF